MRLNMYRLLWEDQFKINGKPDDRIWDIQKGGQGFGNNEDQYYTDHLENVYVKDGMLHIVGLKEEYEHRHYTSGKLVTYKKQHIKYGKLEVEAKLPAGNGTWPAIWLLGENIKRVGWPLCGEIDVMEHVGKNHGHVHFSLHSDTYNHKLCNHPTYVIENQRVTDEFHTYGIEWQEQQITFTFDHEKVITFKKEIGDTDREWPFDQPFYLILNLAIGGNWGGVIDDTIFPVEFLIKSVKVFERVDSND